MPKILVVEDHLDTARNICELLKMNGHKAQIATNGKAALKQIKNECPNLIILDLNLPIVDGWEVLDNIKSELKQGLAVIIITAYGDINSAVKAIKMGGYDFIEKPFNNQVLLLTVERALSNQKIKKELNELKETLDLSSDARKIFGPSETMKKVTKRIETIAPTDMAVLITGENGTGKEVVAKLIHEKSPRRKFKFMPVDCGAIPSELLTSELFGFEKGAFTGAYKKSHGKFKAAHRGTLYLDEVGNLSLKQQRSLLRAVQFKTISPIGSQDTTQIDIRLIFATNEDLEALVAEKKFRKDLYYRLCEYTIHMPPLRDRREDIPHLAYYFIKESNRELNKNINSISNKAMAKLIRYHWPGNVRQLRNYIRRAMLQAETEILPEHIDIPSSVHVQPEELHSFDKVEQMIDQLNFDNYKTALDHIMVSVEKKLVQNALKISNYNVSEAARIFGIDRSAFYRKMDKYDINP